VPLVMNVFAYIFNPCNRHISEWESHFLKLQLVKILHWIFYVDFIQTHGATVFKFLSERFQTRAMHGLNNAVAFHRHRFMNNEFGVAVRTCARNIGKLWRNKVVVELIVGTRLANSFHNSLLSSRWFFACQPTSHSSVKQTTLQRLYALHWALAYRTSYTCFSFRIQQSTVYYKYNML
jgi:hypothetical protein